MRYQQTIRKSISCHGIGLHTGCEVDLTLKPAPPDTGIIFFRRDQGESVRAHVDNVSTSAFSSSLGTKQTEVRTVEHLLAAVAGFQVDNLYIEIDAPEIPILDGSAAPFIRLLRMSGIEQQTETRPYLRVLEPVEIRDGDKYVRIEPSSYPQITYTMEFEHPLLPRQVFNYSYSPEEFVQQVAPARTFGFLKDVEMLQSRGLAKGGSLRNVVVVGEDGVLNREGLRYPDEFIRHKVLDLIGDMSLLGMPFVGHVKAHRSGHSLNVRLVSALLRDNRSWTLVGEPSLMNGIQLSLS